MTSVRSGSATDVGRVRETNQDWLLDDTPLYAVADGMGGHAGGEVASRTAVETLRAAFGSDPSSTGLVEAVRQANLAVWERSRSNEDLRGMGTTLTAAALVTDDHGEHLTLVNVGDSRAYIFRNGHLSQLTDDHSVVEELVRSGDLSAEEAAFHPQRHILTRALGIEPEVDVDSLDVTPEPGDRVLICSDGLSNEMGDGEIASVLRRIENPRDAARELVALARAYGGSDNITVLVIDVVDDEGAGEERVSPVAVPVAPEARPTDAKASQGPDAQASRAPGTPHAGPAEGAQQAAVGRSSPGTLATTSLPAVEPDATKNGGAVSYELANVTTSAPLQAGAHEKRRRSRRITLRVCLFILLILAVLAAAAAAIGWFAERSYYVGLSGNDLVIYQGRPGGLLWFKPRVEQRTSVTTSDVLPSRIPDLRQGTQEPTLAAARAYVSNLVSEARSTLGSSSSSSTTTTPSLLVPPTSGAQPSR